MWLKSSFLEDPDGYSSHEKKRLFCKETDHEMSHLMTRCSHLPTNQKALYKDRDHRGLIVQTYNVPKEKKRGVENIKVQW